MGPILWGVDPVVYTPPPKKHDAEKSEKGNDPKKTPKNFTKYGETFGGETKKPGNHPSPTKKVTKFLWDVPRNFSPECWKETVVTNSTNNKQDLYGSVSKFSLIQFYFDKT